MQALIEQHLAIARTQIAAKDNASALSEHLRPALELEPTNSAALALKRQAEDALESAVQAKRAARGTGPRLPPGEVEVPGIPQRQDESAAEYAARARRVQTAYNAGKASFDKNEYAAAINHFRAVEREQPRYQNVDSLLSETLTRQQNAVDEALTSGQQNEQAGKLHDARLWYQKALERDPGSTSARDKANQARARATAEANDLFTKASASEKLNEVDRAIQYYQQIVDMMLPGDEIRDRAAKRLEALKR